MAAGKGREGRDQGKKKKKASPAMSSTRTGNLVILIAFRARKAVPHLWGKA